MNRIRTTTRNFAIHVPEDKKEFLKILAKESGMTLTQYVEAVLSEAASNKDIFQIQAVKVQSASEKVAVH